MYGIDANALGELPTAVVCSHGDEEAPFVDPFCPVTAHRNFSLQKHESRGITIALVDVH